MSNVIYINNLPLPAPLTEAIESGIWQTPKSRESWRSIFSDKEIVQPLLYPLGQMQGVASWLTEAGATYLGKAGEGFMPGDIDPTRTVLIGDLGPDRLIALDYRESDTQPSVVALTSEEHSYWVRVADDVESLMRMLGLIR
jgi:hypothetical protein